MVGASRGRTKYGNKVLRCYMVQGKPVYAVKPHASAVVGEAADVGIGHLWMQPGAESGEALDRARGLGLSVIADGSCILDVLGYHD